MSKDSSPISVTVLEKEYLINCEAGERESLRRAADFLNQKMDEMKNSGVIIGAERIAIMTALNITNELLAYKRDNQDYTSSVDNTLKRLQNKINDALARDTQLDMVDASVSQGE
ncbi:MAG TPA: cell division protein ZapA [Thiotrichaceae bacterium]|jgi:cell division protein ZapA|nr:cell division protein ZapA [Thiotrichaceae bacterium]HIM08546.1 cell division protein ZapA [Gammaproteobacteria bacterium]